METTSEIKMKERSKTQRGTESARATRGNSKVLCQKKSKQMVAIVSEKERQVIWYICG